MPADAIFRNAPAELVPLVALTRRTCTPEDEKRIWDWISESGDVNRLLSLAQDHGLTPLLYRGLVQLSDKPELLAFLCRKLESAITEDIILYEFVYPGQLAEIVSALAVVGIECLILKGYALGQTIYQQAAMRQYGDIDLLVREEHVDEAEQVLLHMGYQSDESLFSREWYRGQHHHLAPLVQPGKLPVELHRGLVTPGGSLRVKTDILWQKAQPMDVNGVQAHTLCPEHLLVYLCVHAVRTHLLEMGLRPLCDLQELLTTFHNQLDWELIVVTCQQWKCQRHVFLQLELVRALYGVHTPEVALQTLHTEPLSPAFLDYCLTNVLAAAVTGLQESSGLAEVWQESSALKRGRRAMARLFPSRETLADHYHLPPSSALIWLCYPHWQFNLLRRHLGTAWELIRGNPLVLEEARRETIRRDLVGWLGD